MTKKKQFCPRGHDSFQGGRDRSGRCLICKAEDIVAKETAAQTAIAESRAAFERRQAEADRRREREYRKAIAEGGDVAAEARWQRAYSEASEKGRGLCQWQNDDDVHICFRFESFAGGVYCRVHNRQLERETARRRRDDERATR